MCIYLRVCMHYMTIFLDVRVHGTGAVNEDIRISQVSSGDGPTPVLESSPDHSQPLQGTSSTPWFRTSEVCNLRFLLADPNRI